MKSLVVAFVCVGCATAQPAPATLRPPAVAPTQVAASGVATSEAVPATTIPAARPLECPHGPHWFDGGVDRGPVCPDTLAREGLTIVELGDAWTPSMFAIAADGTAPTYRATYLQLAAERDERGEPARGAAVLNELYGVVPSLEVVRARLADVERHACRAALDVAPIARLDRTYTQDHGALVKRQVAVRRSLERQLERHRARLELDDLAALADVPAVAAKYARWRSLADQHAGLVAAQQVLGCEGFLPAKYVTGALTWRTGDAVELYQRRNFLMPNERIDPETRVALGVDSHELDFLLALRVLRERVVDASGLLEDGTALDGPGQILGRALDPAAMRAVRGREAPLPHGAPDLVSAATEAAATQLGWTSAAAVEAFLTAHAEGVRVALALPPVPDYHGPHMALTAELDRGDVYYDVKPIRRRIARRPTLIVYVDDGGTRRPLVRWPTTIGGWADVRTKDGWVHQKWKESDVGPRVWRKLFAAPTWLPPRSTPDADLVRNLYNGRYELKDSVLGPGPHAAFGLALLIHENVVQRRDGTERYWSNGIASHGSSSVTSIVNGTSHGCHRLYNQLAVRLADFLLRHRDHIVKGQLAVSYRRVVRHKGSFVAKVTTRGFEYEFTPPVPVNVLPGNIKTRRKRPPVNSAPVSE